MCVYQAGQDTSKVLICSQVQVQKQLHIHNSSDSLSDLMWISHWHKAVPRLNHYWPYLFWDQAEWLHFLSILTKAANSTETENSSAWAEHDGNAGTPFHAHKMCYRGT